MRPNPAALIPADALPDDSRRYFAIRRVAMIVRPKFGPARDLVTDSSLVVFAALREAAHTGAHITHFSCDGLDLDADSLAALNCFLRAIVPMGRMHHPWDRLPHAAKDTRFEFSELSQHLGLNFR